MARRPRVPAPPVERATSDIRVAPLHADYKADAVWEALMRYLYALPSELRKSRTWHRGRETADHR